MSARHSRHRLWIVLGLSLALHLAVLGGWQSSPPQRFELASQPVSLSVALEAIQVAPRPPSAAKATPLSPILPQRVITTDQKMPAQTASRQAMPGSQATVRDNRAPLQPVKPALDRARIITHLRQDLAQYFTYPPLARRRNLQGTVVLAFDVTNEGRIEAIGVLKSSGYAILDLAAQDAMQRLTRLDWLAGKLDRDRMNIELPVIYKLTES